MAVRKPKIHRVSLEGEFVISNAAVVREQLLNALNQHTTVEVSLANVTEFDSAGLQIMVAAKKYATSKNSQLTFIDHSENVVELLDLSQMTAFFGDPVVMYS